METEIGKLYHVKHKIQMINGRPVNKVEVIQHNAAAVVFLTDYPVERISMPEDEFHRKFERW
jgi:hypothetical protein